MSNLNVAIAVASEYHKKQNRWNGEPYILHPIRVMLEMDTVEEQIVAVLHDIIEDTKMTVSMLKGYGFDNVVIEAIEAISKK